MTTAQIITEAGIITAVSAYFLGGLYDKLLNKEKLKTREIMEDLIGRRALCVEGSKEHAPYEGITYEIINAEIEDGDVWIQLEGVDHLMFDIKMFTLL